MPVSAFPRLLKAAIIGMTAKPVSCEESTGGASCGYSGWYSTTSPNYLTSLASSVRFLLSRYSFHARRASMRNAPMVANAASMKINRSNIGLRLLSKAPPAPDHAATPRAILSVALNFGELAARLPFCLGVEGGGASHRKPRADRGHKLNVATSAHACAIIRRAFPGRKRAAVIGSPPRFAF